MLCFVFPRYAKDGGSKVLAKSYPPPSQPSLHPCRGETVKVKFVYNQLTGENGAWPNQMLYHLRKKHLPRLNSSDHLWPCCCSEPESSVEAVLVKNVEMVGEQTHQMAELLHMAQIQNTHLKQLISTPTDTDDDTDADVADSSVLMTSIGEL